MTDPTKFRNEFGESYAFDAKNMKMPDVPKLRGGAEAFMAAAGPNRAMSPQNAVDLYLMVTEPAYREKGMEEGRFAAATNGNPIVKGRDGKWYYVPEFSTGPTPQGM